MKLFNIIMPLLIIIFAIFVLIFQIISSHDHYENSENINVHNNERNSNMKRLLYNNRGPVHDFHKHFDSVNGDYPEWLASIKRYNNKYDPNNIYDNNLHLSVNNIDNVYKYVNY